MKHRRKKSEILREQAARARARALLEIDIIAARCILRRYDEIVLYAAVTRGKIPANTHLRGIRKTIMRTHTWGDIRGNCFHVVRSWANRFR